MLGTRHTRSVTASRKAFVPLQGMRNFLLIWLAFCGIRTAQAQFSYREVEVLYDSAWTYKNLQLVPIKFKAGRGQGGIGEVISLQEALLEKKVSLKEVEKKFGADKRYLTITNKTQKNILIQTGELVNGGKQDRAVAQTILIPPGRKKEVIEVYCIEKNRWDDKPRAFKHSGSGDLELRQIIDTRKSQVAVWKEIDRKFEERKEASKTWSYLQIHNDSTRGNLDYTRYFTRKMDESGGGFAGFLFVTGSTIVSVELFSEADLTTAVFKSMLATYVNSMLAVDDAPAVTDERKKQFLDAVLTTRETQVKLIKQQGNAYRYEGKMLHMIVYGTGF